MSIKANRGEWSEFYAFLKILCERRLSAADENVRLLSDIKYPIRQIIRQEEGEGSKMIFDLREKQVKLIREDGTEQMIRTDFCDTLNAIFQSIKDHPPSNGAFELSMAENLMMKTGCKKVKASSAKKTDIVLVIDEPVEGTEPQVNFSIKSQLGGASTLLNASSHTNFIYHVQGITNAETDTFTDSIQLKSTLQSGGSVEFYKMESSEFEMNLRKIDSSMPEIIAEIVKAFYSGKGNSLVELVQYMTETNPLNKHIDKDFYTIKVKDLLFNLALGLTPSKYWDGSLQAHGGYIIVREDGELACYHVYNFDRFKNYLLKNTKLEKPSTGRHRYGNIYTEENEMYLKLNLQIRFIK